MSFFESWMPGFSLPGGLKRQDDGAGAKMAVQKTRWSSGKTKNASGSQNGRPDGENAGREAKNGAGKTRKAFGRPDARVGSVRAGSLTSEVRQGTVRRAVPGVLYPRLRVRVQSWQLIGYPG